MARVDLSDVYHHAQEIISAGSCKLLAVFPGIIPAVRIREHVELEREMHRCLDLSSTFISALLEFESL